VLLGGAVLVPLAVLVGLRARYLDWPAAVPLGAALVVVLVALAAVAVAWDDAPRRRAALGAATVAVVLSALLVVGAVLLTQRPATAWQRFALVAGAALASLLLASVDWSRRWLLRLTLVFVAATAVLLVQIGHADLETAKERKVLLSIADARHEAEGLDAVAFAPPENPEPAERPQAKANFDAALVRACRAARAEGVLTSTDDPEPIEAALAECGTGDEQAGDLDDALYELGAGLARYRFLTTGDDADRKALGSALAAEPELRTTSFVDAAGRGPAAVLDSLSGTDDADRLTPGPVGWILLGALALLGWGALLGRNARQLAGPVLVEKLSSPETYDPDLRIAVLENVHEPGAVPGANVLRPVTDLLGLSPAAGTVSKIVQTVFTVIGQAYGYRVEVVVDEPDDDTAPARVLVRVKDLRSSATLAGHVEHGSDTGAAVRAAGLWAAGFILDRSSRVPSWAAWTPATARSLGQRRDGTPSLADLQRAVQGSPNSGVLLVELGQAHELEGQQIDALDCYARAVAAHPTYLLARYRLAAAAAMLARTMAATWLTLGPPRRDAIVDSLERACRTLPSVAAGRAMQHVRQMAAGEGAERACLLFAKELLEEVEHQTSLGGILTTSLRREERDDRMDRLWSTGPSGSRQRTHWLARSARLSCACLLEQDPAKQQRMLDQLAAKATQRGTWWQVGYNAACAHLLAGRPDTAITLLEECLLHPGADQLDARWLRHDPDLETIHHSPRFKRLVERVEEGG